jgi:hypothetical protein
MFSKWDAIEVRLDIWHFLRRMARACTSGSHPLHATFLVRLSSCIYEWDERDYLLLVDAKRGELRPGRDPSSFRECCQEGHLQGGDDQTLQEDDEGHGDHHPRNILSHYHPWTPVASRAGTRCTGWLMHCWD